MFENWEWRYWEDCSNSTLIPWTYQHLLPSRFWTIRDGPWEMSRLWHIPPWYAESKDCLQGQRFDRFYQPPLALACVVRFHSWNMGYWPTIVSPHRYSSSPLPVVSYFLNQPNFGPVLSIVICASLCPHNNLQILQDNQDGMTYNHARPEFQPTVPTTSSTV